MSLTDEEWISLNERRWHLIHKKHSSGLTVEEARELDELQVAADAYVDEVAPLEVVL